MKDLIIVAIVVLIVGLAAWYVYKAKKSGKTCIGCPHACSCSKVGSCKSYNSNHQVKSGENCSFGCSNSKKE